jgi:hypothetical protein
MDNPDPEYRSAAQVRKRYGNVSGMSLWRWLNDPETDFPPPDQIISGRRYWLITTLDAFDARSAQRRIPKAEIGERLTRSRKREPKERKRA